MHENGLPEGRRRHTHTHTEREREIGLHYREHSSVESKLIELSV